MTLECIVQGNGTDSGNSNGASGDHSRLNRRQHWWTRLPGWGQHVDEESYTCYVLFILIFVLDFSLLTMLFPVTLAAYALATQKPSQRYWQVGLLRLAMFSLFLACSCACFAFACLPLVFLSWLCLREGRFMCCAVLCCAVLRCAALRCAVLGWAGLGWTGLCLPTKNFRASGVCIPQLCCC